MKSIAVKLWLGITAIVILILVLIWGFQVGLLKEFYIRERQASLAQNNQSLVTTIVEESPDLVFDSAFQDTIDSYSEHLNVRILIVDDQFTIRYLNFGGFGRDSMIPPDLDMSLLINQSIDDINNNNRVVSPNDKDRTTLPRDGDEVISNRIITGLRRQFEDLNLNRNLFTSAPFTKAIRSGPPLNSTIVSVYPIIVEDETQGYVLMHTPLAPIEETIETLKDQLTIISVISIIIATTMAFLYAAVAIKPVRRLEEATKRIAKGDFTTRVDNMSEDEIGQLGRSINHMAEELGKIEAFRRDFIANVTHELKTPISLISAYAELVREIPDMDKNNCNLHMDEIIEESARLNKIVEEILYLSKLESDNIPLNNALFSIKCLTEDIFESLRMAAQKKNITLEHTLTDALNFNGDREKMYQVFYNIISNSIHHCPENSKVEISTQPIEQGHRILIQDNGPGIPNEDLPYIWNRFYKIDKSGHRNSTGTGLGMSIVKTILEAHNLHFGLQSAVGSGTTVYFDIPDDSYTLETKNPETSL